MDEEQRTHFENQVEKLVASGVSLEEAIRRAALEFGGLDQVKEDCRDLRGVNFIENFVQDVRFCSRMGSALGCEPTNNILTDRLYRSKGENRL